jgi:hypothetical protein
LRRCSEADLELTPQDLFNNGEGCLGSKGIPIGSVQARLHTLACEVFGFGD